MELWCGGTRVTVDIASILPEEADGAVLMGDATKWGIGCGVRFPSESDDSLSLNALGLAETLEVAPPPQNISGLATSIQKEDWVWCKGRHALGGSKGSIPLTQFLEVEWV